LQFKSDVQKLCKHDKLLGFRMEKVPSLRRLSLSSETAPFWRRRLYEPLIVFSWLSF
jgi:hypothetical protein